MRKSEVDEMKTNREKLPMMSVSGSVDHPGLHGDGYWVGYDGYGRIAMSVGGIVYNYSLLDPCMGIVGDHIEPGVSIKNSVDKYNTALQCFACIGNEARIVNGPAAGQKGYVSGKHGGVDHVMVWFPREVLEKMNADERILIRAWGQGMKLTDHPGVQLMNLDPDLLDAMDLQHGVEGKLQVPVVTRIPAFLMGAGIGSTTTMSGDYDIMTQDHEANQKYGIDRLRFGDLVLIEDHDNTHGPHYRQGAVSIGVIVHSDSFTSGHGPGVTVIMSADEDTLEGIIDPDANIANYMNKIKR